MSIVESKPFCMLTTIHSEPTAQLEVTKMIYDREEKKKLPKLIPRLVVNDDYNHKMNFVDVRDQLAKNYEIGGPHWRHHKWTAAVSDDLIKRGGDAAYEIYRRVCELDEEERAAEERADASRRGDSPAAGSRSRARVRPIVPKSHLDFLEELAGGLIITAYNVQKGIREEDKLPLTGDGAADPIKVLELFSRSTGTVRMASSQSGKRAAPLSAAMSSEARVAGAGHCLQPIPATAKSKSGNPYCNFADCPYGAGNKQQKCGPGSVYMEKGRSRCTFWCPACKRYFHADCCNKYHGWGDYAS